MSRRRWIATGAAIAIALAIAIGVLATGSGDSQADDAVLVDSDNREKGDPDLGGDRIRVTPKGLWTAVFWVELDDLTAGEQVLAGVNIQLTNCRPSDLTPASTSSCKGTAPYDFTPKIESKLVLAQPGSGGAPQLSGTPMGATRSLECTAKLHHCVPALFGDLEIKSEETGTRYVTLLVRATNPKAKPCRPAAPARCNVLQLTHGQGRLGVARERRPGLEPPKTTNEQERANELRMAKTKAQKQKFREVIYSVKLDKPGPVLLRGELQASFDLDYPTPPLVNKQLILAASPTATTGTTIEPQNGENCEGTCSYVQPGLLPCLTEDDLQSGNKYVNLVGFASRASAFASPKHGVEILNGGFLEARQYAAELAPIACG